MKIGYPTWNKNKAAPLPEMANKHPEFEYYIVSRYSNLLTPNTGGIVGRKYEQPEIGLL